MKNLIATLIALSSLSAFAQVTKTDDGKLTVPTSKVDVLLTESSGYVSPREILEQGLKVPGTRIENGNVVIDLRNPKLDVTSIILNSGANRDVRKLEGGDMGGGGRTIQIN
ncbi:MAG: hypothetical protein K2X53_04925 [Alphaproteobacteria bacterium]|nr:hypothetical protein [Alphaproteobacteria bacterium]